MTTRYTLEAINGMLGHPLGTEYVQDEATLDEWIDQARQNGDAVVLRELIDVQEAPFRKGHDKAVRESDMCERLSEAERWVLRSESENVLDDLRTIGMRISAEDLEMIGYSTTKTLLREPLRLKLLMALHIEHSIQDTPPVDGILGRAVDEAMELGRRYQRPSLVKL